MNKIKKIELKYIDGVVKLLKDISPYTPPKSTYRDNFLNFSSQDNCHGYVITEQDLVVAYGSIFYENKIRGGKVGHIEDIVVKKSHRGKNIGKMIIDFLIKKACENDCYKISLECKESNIGFYESCGLMTSGVSMNKILK